MHDANPSPRDAERPLLKAPHWGWNVVSYLFVGGIAGGLGIVALAARDDRVAERRMRRTARFAALALAAASPPLLIGHLGRPERFLNMLRIVKFRSPMSLGVWGLLVYSGVAAANVAREAAEVGILPGTVRRAVPAAFGPLHALLGAFLAGYTGVLLSATANPLWSAGKRHIPAACVASGVAGACALTSLLSAFSGNREPLHKLERLESVAAVAELFVLLDFRRQGGRYATPLFGGALGKRLGIVTMLGGILAPLALNVIGETVNLPPGIDRARTIVASLLALAGGYVFRGTLVEAGKTSASDPRVAFRQPQ